MNSRTVWKFDLKHNSIEPPNNRINPFGAYQANKCITRIIICNRYSTYYFLPTVGFEIDASLSTRIGHLYFSTQVAEKRDHIV